MKCGLKSVDLFLHVSRASHCLSSVYNISRVSICFFMYQERRLVCLWVITSQDSVLFLHVSSASPCLFMGYNISRVSVWSFMYQVRHLVCLWVITSQECHTGFVHFVNDPYASFHFKRTNLFLQGSS